QDLAGGDEAADIRAGIEAAAVGGDVPVRPLPRLAAGPAREPVEPPSVQQRSNEVEPPRHEAPLERASDVRLLAADQVERRPIAAVEAHPQVHREPPEIRSVSCASK